MSLKFALLILITCCILQNPDKYCKYLLARPRTRLEDLSEILEPKSKLQDSSNVAN